MTGLISSKCYFVVIGYSERYSFLRYYLLCRQCGDLINYSLFGTYLLNIVTKLPTHWF